MPTQRITYQENFAQSKTSPKSNTQGTIVKMPAQYRITDIPKTMDKKGWTVAAKLMRKWFKAEARAMKREEKDGTTPPSMYPENLLDTSTVTMQWVLGFERGKHKYDEIFSPGIFGERVYETEAAKKELTKKIIKAGKFTNGVERFGNLAAQVIDVDQKCQFQLLKVSASILDNTRDVAVKMANKEKEILDDMYGALGVFCFKIAGAGLVTPHFSEEKKEPSYYEVTVQEIGVYIRDTYDFIDSQYLGHWNAQDVEYAPLQKGYIGDGEERKFIVENKHFREYRENFKKGGDMLIFSDVQVTKLPTPFTFIVSRSAALGLTGEFVPDRFD